PVPTGYTYLAGYERAGYMFADIEKTYNKPNLLADLNALSKNNGDVNELIKTQTGLTLGELWTKITGARITSQLTFKNAAATNVCADVFNSSTANNAPVGVYTCNSTEAQQWIFIPTSNTSQDGVIKANLGQSNGGGQQKCLNVTGNGTAQGTDVVMTTCSGSVGQKWVIQHDGTIRNPNANKCLQPQNGSTAAFTILEVYPCAGTNIQKWGVRTPETMNSQSAASPFCVDATNGATASSSWVWVTGCDYSIDQQLTYKQVTPGGAGTYSLNGGAKCLDILNGGTADGTRVIFTNCHNGTSQQWVRNPSMRLSNPATGKCLQLENNATTSGTYLVISTCNANATQKWNWATL
ncbi:MAG TPA: RICIN domain-containing protein, partial [Candidatus Saccharimonadales bacterium]|nr:RICIN domain-containing protein [Candidatus Saccharimonadales bacterium]